MGWLTLQGDVLIDDAGTRALVVARPAMSGWMGDIVLKIQAARRG